MTNEQYQALYNTALSEIKGVMEKHGLTGAAIVLRPPQDLERDQIHISAMASCFFAPDTTLFDQSGSHGAMDGEGRIRGEEDYEYNEERFEQARTYSLKALNRLVAGGRQLSQFAKDLHDKIEHRSMWSLFRF